MFVIHPYKDTLEVDARDLGQSTGAVIHRKIDEKYPNRYVSVVDREPMDRSMYIDRTQQLTHCTHTAHTASSPTLVW